jgi:ABC-2 type transport system permease protein
MAELSTAPAQISEHRDTDGAGAPRGRPSVWALFRDQVVHASRDTWRTPISLLVSLLFPVLFLAISGLAMGAGPGDGGAVIQRLVPGAAVFAVAMAAFVMLPYSVALAAEQGILKRVRGTPLPAWAYLAGRLGVAVWVAVAGTAVMLVAGMVGYGLQVTPRTLPAFVLGLLVTIVTFAALGLALALWVRSSQTVISITMGAVVLLGFVSDLYGFEAAMPRWLETIGWSLPLRHAVEVLAVPLQVGVTGSGVAQGSLLALLAWGGAGGILAIVAYRREPRGARGRRSGVRRDARSGVLATGSSGPLGMVWGQLRHANRSIWREPVFAGFALVLPTLFVTVLPVAVGNPEIDGMSFAASMTTGMPIFGAALIAYVAMPELIASARDRGVLKRLRGTPLPAWALVAGRVLSVLWVVSITVGIVLAAGWLLHDTAPVAAAWPALLLVLAVTVVCFSALGLAVAALAPDADAVPAITLATFLPLVFLSGIFPLGDALPGIIPTIVAWLPMAPAVDAVRAAFTTGGVLVGELAVVGAWAVLGAVVAVARFRWE